MAVLVLELDLANLDLVFLFFWLRVSHAIHQIVVQAGERSGLRLQQLCHEVFHHTFVIVDLGLVLKKLIDL